MNISRKYLREAQKIIQSIGTPQGMPRLRPICETLSDETEDQRYRREVLRIVRTELDRLGLFRAAELYAKSESRPIGIEMAAQHIMQTTANQTLVDNFCTWARIPGDVE